MTEPHIEIIKPEKKNVPSNFVQEFLKDNSISLEQKIIRVTVVVLVTFVLIKFAINLF